MTSPGGTQQAGDVGALMRVLWGKYREATQQRVEVIAVAIVTMLEGALTDELREAAEREAHRLAGSLGTFGFPEGSRLAREIEALLKEAPMTVRELVPLLEGLRHELSQEPATVSGTQAAEEAARAGGGRILIIDDDQTLAQGLADAARARGMAPTTAHSVEEAQQLISGKRPDAVLLDITIGDHPTGGLEVLESLARRWLGLPVVVLSAHGEQITRLAAARLGAVGYLQKPVAPEDALAMLDQAARRPARVTGKVLVVDDDPHLLHVVRVLLGNQGHTVKTLDNPDSFCATLEADPPDLLVLDVDMPRVNGVDLCRIVRADPRWMSIPVLFLTAKGDFESIQRGFKAGADDYITKPLMGPELVARIANRLERVKTA